MVFKQTGQKMLWIYWIAKAFDVVIEGHREFINSEIEIQTFKLLKVIFRMSRFPVYWKQELIIPLFNFYTWWILQCVFRQ